MTLLRDCETCEKCQILSEQLRAAEDALRKAQGVIAAIGEEAVLAARFGLSPQQSAFLAILARSGGVVSAGDIFEAISRWSDDPEPDIVKMTKFRVKQRCPNIQIVSVYGQGYMLTDASRQEVFKAMGLSTSGVLVAM